MTRKILIAALAGVMLVACAACGPGKSENADPPSGGDPSEEYPSAVSFGKDVFIVSVGEQARLDLFADGEAVAVADAEWSVSGEAVALEGGTVTAAKAGVATVTATYRTKTATAYIGVKDEGATYTLGETDVKLDAGETCPLQVTAGGSAYTDVAWTSSDSAIVTVSDEGVLTGVAAGTVLVQAEVHGQTLVAKATVRGVDGKLDEWFDGDGLPLYHGTSLWDADPENSARGFVVYARKTDEGVWFGGYAFHRTRPYESNLWWKIPNFEVFCLQSGNALQYWASEKYASAGSVGKLTTVANNTDETAVDHYKSTFELFIPFVTESEYIRASFAFRVFEEQMAMMHGGSDLKKEYNDWWWIDRHHPRVPGEMFYIYADGLYAAAKEG